MTAWLTLSLVVVVFVVSVEPYKIRLVVLKKQGFSNGSRVVVTAE
jgi:hypothetical protein